MEEMVKEIHGMVSAILVLCVAISAWIFIFHPLFDVIEKNLRNEIDDHNRKERK